jgi:LacI family transcriptional regulator
MRATIRTVAERAGVSAMTVSNVLRGRTGEVSEDTRQRVLDAVAALNYVPVAATRQNRHVETHLLGLVPYSLDLTETALDTATYRGIYPAAREADYDLLLLLRSQSPLFTDREETRFLDRRSDGFLFISPGMGDWQRVLDALSREQVPTLVLYRRDVPEGVAWVDPDNEGIVALALERLRQAGHTRIGYLAGPRDDFRRREGGEVRRVARNFDSAAREAAFARLQPGGDVLTGVSAGWVVPEDLVENICRAGVTAVLAENDQLALQLLPAAQKHRLSVIGIDDLPESARAGLTTVRFGYENVGRQAVEAWLALRSGTEASACSRVVPGILIERASIYPQRRDL